MHSFTSLHFASLSLLSLSHGIGVCQCPILVFLFSFLYYEKNWLACLSLWSRFGCTRTEIGSVLIFLHKQHRIAVAVCTINESEWQHQKMFIILLINDCASIISLMSIYWMFSHIKWRKKYQIWCCHYGTVGGSPALRVPAYLFWTNKCGLSMDGIYFFDQQIIISLAQTEIE